MHMSLACWYTLVILALGSYKQEEHEFEASLSYPVLKNKTKSDKVCFNKFKMNLLEELST